MRDRNSTVIRLVLLAVFVAIEVGLAWASSEADFGPTRIAQVVIALTGLVVFLGPLLEAGERAWDWAASHLDQWGQTGRERLAARLDPAKLPPAGGGGEIAVYGRDEVVADVVGRIEREGVGGWCCYGFMGVGKSTVIREVEAVAAETLHLRVVSGTFPTGPTRPSFCQVVESLVGWSDTSADEWMRLERLIDRLGETLVVLDAFPHADEDAIAQLTWLLSELRKRKVHCFFVLASQERPSVPETAITCVELHGIDPVPFSAYCADICAHGGREPLSEEQVALLYERTGGGNPQLARMAITNGFSPSGELNVPEDEIESRVWGDASADVRGALRVLAALHRFEPEVPERELTQIVTAWSDVRIGLIKKNLNVPASVETFKTHDLVNAYVRRHDDASVRLIHQDLARYYVDSPYFASESRPARLAASHCAASQEPGAFAEHYLLIAERLRAAGEAKALRTLAETGLAFRQRLPGDVGEEVRVDLAWALAQIGETEQALDLFIDLLEDLALEVDGGGSTSVKRATLMRQIADCRRLRGDVAGAEQDLREAAAVLAAYGEGSGDEAIACLLDHAHCGYLAADPDESLRRLDEIRTLCERRAFEAEWWYRHSKAQRLRWDLEQALTSARHSRQLADRSESPLGVAKGMWAEVAAERLAMASGDDSTYERLVALAEEVKRAFTNLGYRAAIFVVHDIADLHRVSGRHELALERFEETQRLTAAMGETNREAHSWLGIAETVRGAGGQLGALGTDEHLDAYRQAKHRYEAMGNVWGVAVSTLGAHLATGLPATGIADSVLTGSCCQGERRLVANGGTAFPLNFV